MMLGAWQHYLLIYLTLLSRRYSPMLPVSTSSSTNTKNLALRYKFFVVVVLFLMQSILFLFFFLRFYLFIHETQRERERKRHRQREKQAPQILASLQGFFRQWQLLKEFVSCMMQNLNFLKKYRMGSRVFLSTTSLLSDFQANELCPQFLQMDGAQR